MYLRNKLERVITGLIEALRRIDTGWGKPHRSITKRDLQEMEQRMAIKLSDLKMEVAGLRAQVVKIWGEQQARYDDLVKAFEDLKAQIEDGDLDAETEAALTEFKSLLQGFDDTIPDVEPPVEPPVSPV